MPSGNNLIIKSLVNTIQSGSIDYAKAYDLLNRMNQDLNQVFNALFDGPLPAVDGFALTRLNAAVLEGEIPASFNIAYTDVSNVFWLGQTIVENDEEVPFWTFGFGNLLSDPVVDPTSYLRIGSLVDGEFFISQNALWNGSAFEQDDAGIDSLVLNLISGDLSLFWWDGTLGDFRNTWSFSGRDLHCANFDDDDTLLVVEIDDADVIHLGGNAAVDTTPVGWVTIPGTITANLPAAGATANGIIGINLTTNRLIYYANGNRYFLPAGTTF